MDLVRSTLEPSGYEVVAAHSAKEGLDLAHRIKPDLIISDVHMPHQDGYEFMRMVQQDPELSKIPFVFLSSSVWSTREQGHALLQGARKFISRPIEPEKLLSELKECLRKGTGTEDGNYPRGGR
jgi:CheY-like chemotaxis protein